MRNDAAVYLSLEVCKLQSEFILFFDARFELIYIMMVLFTQLIEIRRDFVELVIKLFDLICKKIGFSTHLIYDLLLGISWEARYVRTNLRHTELLIPHFRYRKH